MVRVDKREKILAAASKCIAQKGYANVSLRDIADEANVVLSQLNYYFGNKEVIFCEIIKNFVDNFTVAFNQYLNVGQFVENKIELLTGFLKKTAEDDSMSFKLFCDFLSMSLWSENFKKVFKEITTKFTKIVEENLFKKKTINDNYNKYSISMLANVVVNTMFGTIMQFSMADNKELSCINSLGVMGEIFK